MRPLPRDTRNAATHNRLNSCQNFGLLLEKFQPWNENQGLERVRIEDTSFLRRGRIQQAGLQAAYKRWARMVTARGATPFELYTDSGLSVGLGSHTVMETHIQLHHIYGYPIISGTALKGLARTVALHHLAGRLGVPALPLAEYWQRKSSGNRSEAQPTPMDRLVALLESSLWDAEGKSTKEAEALLQALRDDPAIAKDIPLQTASVTSIANFSGVDNFRAIFGTPGQSGGAVFFDSLPAVVPEIKAEIMNAHYPDYYTNTPPQAPNEGSKLNLVSFLTVAAGCRFGFAVAGCRGLSPEMVQQAIKYLKHGLRFVGIGAKTAAGHGVFSTKKPATIKNVSRDAPSEPTPPQPTPDPTTPPPPSEPLDDPKDDKTEFANDVLAFMQRNQGGS